ncbi:MAG: TonB-dependent receptor, partial [Alphaproteobacteria bacterium]
NDGRVNADQRFNRALKDDDFYYNRDSEGYRIAALLQPLDNFSVYAAYDRFNDDSAGAVALKDCRSAAGTPGACPANAAFEPALINVPGDHNVDDDSFRVIVDYAPLDAVALQYIFGGQDLKREQIVDVDAGQSRLNAWTGTFDAVGDPVFFDNFAQDRYLRWNDTFTKFRSHELQIKSRGDRRLNWIIGGFYSAEKGQVRQFNEEPTSFGFDTATVLNGPFVFNFQTDGIKITSKAVFGQFDFKVVPDLNLTFGWRYTKDRNAFDFQAAYSNANPVNPGLYFDPVQDAPGDGGLWYEASDFRRATNGIDAYPIDSSTSDLSIGFNQFTWRAGIDYRARDLSDTFFYGYVATGYKAGNFDITIPNRFVNFAPVSFTDFRARPEEVTTYEVGAKGTYLDNRLALRLAYYHSDYKDYQFFDFVNLDLVFQLQFPGGDPFTIFTTPIRPLVTQNIGSVDMDGVEAEFRVMPWADGVLSGNFVYADNKISKFNPVAFSQNWFCGIRQARGDLTDCADVSLEGNRLPRTPKFSVNINYSHDFPIADFLVQPSLGVNYRSSFFHNITNFDEGEFSSRERELLLLNANLRLAHEDSGWTVDIWGRNLTDKQRMIGQNVGPAAAGAAGDLGYIVGEFTDPRTYGVRVRKIF